MLAGWQVNYRESISRPADIQYTHKKQSGGAGQFADISVKFEPGEPSSGFTFRSEIKGGAVSLSLWLIIVIDQAEAASLCSAEGSWLLFTHVADLLAACSELLQRQSSLWRAAL